MDARRDPEMTMGDVHWFLALMERQGVDVWLDGGWAVDACLGSRTRRHRDLDIAIEQHHARPSCSPVCHCQGTCPKGLGLLAWRSSW